MKKRKREGTRGKEEGVEKRREERGWGRKGGWGGREKGEVRREGEREG